MGIGLGGRSSFRKSGLNYFQEKVSDKDPNPSVFKILKHVSNKGHTLIWINYPNCTNFEGNKIILFLNTPANLILQQTEIDPHFTDEGSIRPFARFEPTENGWDAGESLMDLL